MSVTTGLIVLVGSTLLLWLALVGLAVVRKMRRDRRELRSVERRSRYEAVLGSGDVGAIADTFSVARSVDARVDLAVSIDAVHRTLPAERFDAIGRGMEASYLRPILTVELGSRRPTTRALAALLLTRPGTAAAVEEVAPLLADPDPDVRLVACSGLARAATPRAAEALIWGLVVDVLPPERIIERLGAPWAVETILTALRDGPSPVWSLESEMPPGGPRAELAASLARALGIAGDSRAAPALAALLDGDSVEIRISAARALGRVGGSPCVPALVAALSSDDWPVRAQAAKSLGSLGAVAALEPLEACLSDRAWWVRANAAGALRALGEPGIEVLRSAVEHEDRYAADRAREQLALDAVIKAQAVA